MPTGCGRLLLSISIPSRNLQNLTIEMYEISKSLVITVLFKQSNGLDYNSGHKPKFTILAVNTVENTEQRKLGFWYILRNERPIHFVRYRSFHRIS